MRTSWSRRRGQGGGGCSTSPGANRFGFGSVMPTASDGPPAGSSSAGGVGVEVAVGVGVAVGAARRLARVIAALREDDDERDRDGREG